MYKLLPFKIVIFCFVLFLFSCSSDSNEDEITVTTQDFTTNMDEYPENRQPIGTVEGSTNQGSVTYSITEQTPVGAFSIDASSGELKVADWELFNFDINPIITGIVKVANGNVFKNATITISLNDLTEEEKIYNGDVYLYSQEGVNNFGSYNYSKINGYLILGPNSFNDISDLHPLGSLKEIIKYFQIKECPNLTSTAGLNFEKVGSHIRLIDNSSLIKIEGLNNITHLEGDLTLRGNNVLADLSGLSQLSSITNLSISDCPLITDLSWLGNITSISRSISIRDNGTLNSLEGLNNLTEATSIMMTANPQLTDFCALQTLFIASPATTFQARDNAFNPTKQMIITGNCRL